jgi:hypothetical protein
MKPLALICFLIATVAFAMAEPVAPDVVLRINGHAEASIPLPLWRGEPVIAEVVLRLSDRDSAQPLTLDPPGGGWATCIKLIVTNASGGSETWPFVMTGKPSSSALTLQPDRISTLVLRIEPTNTAALVPGIYHVIARLDLANGRSWRGVTESEAVDVAISPAPVSLIGPDLAKRQLFRVRDALLAGDLGRAQSTADEMLHADFRQPEGPMAMALVYEVKGDRRKALIYIDVAINCVSGSADSVLTENAVKTPLKPIPSEYFDLRRRIEQMPSTDPEPEPLPDNGVAAGKTSPVPPVKPVVNADDQKFPLDPHGRWAAGAEASSELGTPKFGARQALGPPNVSAYGHHGEAWSSKPGGEAWLKLIFNTPMRISVVRVRQTFNPGAIVKIEAFAADGRTAVLWSGRDTTVYLPNQIAWFSTAFPTTPFPVQSIKLTFDAASLSGSDEIDAVQIVTVP